MADQPTASPGARVRDLWSFRGRYRILHLTWFAYFRTFGVGPGGVDRAAGRRAGPGGVAGVAERRHR